MKTINNPGKRKSAVAKATIRDGTGLVRVNNINVNVIQPKLARMKIQEPLILAGEDVLKKIDILVRTNGGGIMGQAEATRLAIARSLAQHNKKLEKVFHDYDRALLVADVRRKEPYKPGRSKARSKRQKSYR